jgi:glycerophosphoryl diester phosphodiesterase
LILAFIILGSVAASLLFLFLVYLFLIMPSTRRKKQMLFFAKHKYAHRGLHGDGAAENSMSAFRRAVENGYGIELDVRLSRDGELVVFHDTTLDRVTGVSGRVDSKDYSELKDIQLSGTEDTVPLFSDVLRLVDGKVPLLVELKEEAGKYCVTEKTLEILADYKGAYIIESFNPLALGRVKKRSPEILRGILSMNYLSDKKHRNPLYFLLQILAFNVACRPDFIAFDHNRYKSVALRLCRSLFGATTIAWTTRSEAEEKAAFAHKFNSVIFENYLSENNNEA